MLCIRTFTSALFSSNVKCKRIRHVPKYKFKPFLPFNKIIFLLRLESMYSETNKKINSYKNLVLQFSQPIEIQVSNSLRLLLECSKSKGFWALHSWVESRATYMSNAVNIFLIFIPTYQEQRRKLTNNVNLKREYLPSLPGNGAKIWLRFYLHTRIQNLEL